MAESLWLNVCVQMERPRRNLRCEVCNPLSSEVGLHPHPQLLAVKRIRQIVRKGDYSHCFINLVLFKDTVYHLL